MSNKNRKIVSICHSRILRGRTAAAATNTTAAADMGVVKLPRPQTTTTDRPYLLCRLDISLNASVVFGLLRLNFNHQSHHFRDLSSIRMGMRMEKVRLTGPSFSVLQLLLLRLLGDHVHGSLSIGVTVLFVLLCGLVNKYVKCGSLLFLNYSETRC